MLRPTRTPFLFAHGTIFKRPDDKKQGPSAENSRPTAQFDAAGPGISHRCLASVSAERA